MGPRRAAGALSGYPARRFRFGHRGGREYRITIGAHAAEERDRLARMVADAAQTSPDAEGAGRPAPPDHRDLRRHAPDARQTFLISASTRSGVIGIRVIRAPVAS